MDVSTEGMNEWMYQRNDGMNDSLHVYVHRNEEVFWSTHLFVIRIICIRFTHDEYSMMMWRHEDIYYEDTITWWATII